VADGIGLSVGATNLTAVVVGRAAVTQKAVFSTERGVVITDFVDRVGDPVGIVAPDGSSHRAEVLLANALRATRYAATRGQSPSDPVGIAHPAHWRPSAVDALRGAVAAVPEFRTPNPALLVSDAVAAPTALQQDPGLPSRGVIAVCDFGGSGTSVTLVDAAQGFRPVAPTLRYADLSGDLIDQALLTHVIGNLSAAGSIDLSGTSAIGSLTRLRAQCRTAKERLATAAATSLTAELPGHRSEVRVTRNELDDVIRQPLAGFVDELQNLLRRSDVRPADLVAVASVGGGARIPIVTTTLSEHLRVPVVTNAQPELTAAIGAGLKAIRGTVVEGATSIARMPPPPVAAPEPAPAPMSSTFRALAWSEVEVPEPVVAPPPGVSARPVVEFVAPEADGPDEPAPVPWYRHPFAIVAASTAVVLAAIAAAVVFVTARNDEPAPAATATSSATTPPPVTTQAPPPPGSTPTQTQPPSTRTVTVRPQAPVTVTQQAPPPPATSEAPPPPSETPPPETPEPSPTVTDTPTSTTRPRLIPTLPYETIPGLPFVPAPIQPPPG
jgi:Hsp70 protein